MKIPVLQDFAQRRSAGPALLFVAAVALVGCSPSIRIPSDLYAADSIYIAGQNQTSLLQFSATANGTEPPKSMLSLPPAFRVASLATGSDAKIYVGDKASSRVLVYVADSEGADMPTRTLYLGANVLPALLAVDPDNLLYVGTPARGDQRPSINVYSATAEGNVSALRTIQLSRFETLSDIAIDEDGSLYAGGVISLNDGSKSFAIEVFAAKGSGVAAPLRTILIPSTMYGISVRADGAIFAGVMLGNGTEYAVEEFAAGAKGQATAVSTIYLPTPLGGVPTNLAVRIDGAGTIFVSLTYLAGSRTPPSIFIYSYDADANRSANPRTQLAATGGFSTLALTN